MEHVTPPHGKEGLDKLGLAIEVAKAGGNPNWDELAVLLGSASGSSLKKTWQNLQKNHVIRRKGEEDPLSPKPAKVAKPKTPRKKTTPKKGKKAAKEDADMDVDDEEDMDDSLGGVKLEQ